MSISSTYFARLQGLIKDIADSETDAIEKVAALGAASISKQGALHIFDTGHMLMTEMIGRAGGLLAWTPLSISFAVNNPNRFRDKQGAPAPDDLPEYVRLALGRSKLREGDLLFAGSVSGKSAMPVEMALQGKTTGATVIAVTSVEHSSKLESEHPSGKRLYEVADLVLDNHAPPGDAMLEVDGFDRRVCPASGLAAACLLWAVNARVIELLVQQGVQPSVYSSVNLPGGPENVRAVEERYTELGY